MTQQMYFVIYLRDPRTREYIMSTLYQLTQGVIMKAVTWQGKRSVAVKEMPDPAIQEPTDAVIKITSTAI